MWMVRLRLRGEANGPHAGRGAAVKAPCGWELNGPPCGKQWWDWTLHAEVNGLLHGSKAAGWDLGSCW